jgi:hypothetical protein
MKLSITAFSAKASLLLPGLLFAGLGASPALADVVIVESRSGGMNFSSYSEGTGNWQNSSVKSSAPGTTSGIGSRFETADGGFFRVTPTLANAGGTYLVEVTHPTSSNIPTDLQAGVSATGGTGLPTSTTAFNQSNPNVWRTVGTIVLDAGVNQPTITFTKLAGSSGTGQRFYADAVRFTDLSEPCLAVPQIATVNGPLAAGQTYVLVPTVGTTNTNVTVYADGVAIGMTGVITSSVVRVPTEPLVKGQIITATQTSSNGVESCKLTTGAKVGGGANPRLRLSLSIRQDQTATGPIGANGGTASTVIKFLAATNTFGGGFALAPVGGKVVQPDACWQTVTFLRGEDPNNPTDRSYRWSGTDATHNLLGDFGVLESVALAIDDLTDTGPYQIYIDNLGNGETMIQDFESATNGQTSVLFTQPSCLGHHQSFSLGAASRQHLTEHFASHDRFRGHRQQIVSGALAVQRQLRRELGASDHTRLRHAQPAGGPAVADQLAHPVVAGWGDERPAARRQSPGQPPRARRPERDVLGGRLWDRAAPVPVVFQRHHRNPRRDQQHVDAQQRHAGGRRPIQRRGNRRHRLGAQQPGDAHGHADDLFERADARVATGPRQPAVSGD